MYRNRFQIRWVPQPLAAIGWMILLGLLGCRPPTDQANVCFEPNLLCAHQIEVAEDIPMTPRIEETQWILDRMFGTPNQPNWFQEPEKGNGQEPLVSKDNLVKASGLGQGLYAEHCAKCHGITGNGRGPIAALVTPYPRDFRFGVFKFKTTGRDAKPIRQDIARTIRDGIAGTTMVKIPTLSEEDIQALTDYVIYLSVRGELERTLYKEFILELDGEGSIIDPSLAEKDDAASKELFQKQLDWIDDLTESILGTWNDAKDEILEVKLPKDIPVPQSYAEFKTMMESDQATPLKESVKRGNEVFVGKIASCSKCHGETGKGDGQTNDYDDWTKEWTTRAGFKPDKPGPLVPFIARGALPPKNIHPRNFAEGVFRGGNKPEDLYRRIVTGIAGTPMPAVTFVEGEFESEDVWHLVNFIRSLDKRTVSQETTNNDTDPKR